ncbi:TPA: hypothetical protein ACXE8V_001104 [Pluralibacter gergoviae]
MTPATLPQKLWRPLAEVKNYVEKMPDGVRLADISRKVDVFNKLSAKEKSQLVKFLGERESILVVKIKRPNSLNGTTLLRHKKYGYPQSQSDLKVIKDIKSKVCSKCRKEKLRSEFYVNNSAPDGLQSYCKECVKESTNTRSWERGEFYAKRIKYKNAEEDSLMKNQNLTITPESLRKQAEELLKAAEEAEKKRNEDDFFNKKLHPLKLEICQAAGQMQRKMDEFIDCMDVMNKAVQKLKEITA